LIAGKNPPGNLGDMISAMRNQRYFGIGKGKARRSIVHAEDIAGLISKWISNPVKVSGIFNITDGNHPEFREIEAKISMDFELKYLIRIPEIVARTIAFIFGWIRGFPLNKIRLEKMLNSLTFNDDKARAHLAWKPESALKRSWI
jgi:nucleoside-diphosphate-sugar epimerase